jgi:hypothetical protein
VKWFADKATFVIRLVKLCLANEILGYFPTSVSPENLLLLCSSARRICALGIAPSLVSATSIVSQEAAGWISITALTDLGGLENATLTEKEAKNARRAIFRVMV